MKTFTITLYIALGLSVFAVQAESDPLTVRQSQLEQRIRLATNRVLGAATINAKGERQFKAAAHASRHLQKINIAPLAEEIKVALEGKDLNLADLSRSERNSYDVVGAIHHQLKTVLSSLASLNRGSLEEALKGQIKHQQLLDSAFVYYRQIDQRELGLPISNNDNFSLAEIDQRQKNLHEAFAMSMASQLGLFHFERNSQLQYLQMQPEVLLPLYSFGVLCVFDSLAEFSQESWDFFTAPVLEQRTIWLLRSYLTEAYTMDNLTLEVLTIFAKIKSLHPLLRLGAFAAIDKVVGREEAFRLTEISPREWAKLYQNSGTRVVMSPVGEGLHSEAHIDYFANSKSEVEYLFKSVDPIAAQMGLPKPALATRGTVYDWSLPRSTETVSNQLLERYRAERSGTRQALTPIEKSSANQYMKRRSLRLTPANDCAKPLAPL